MGRRHVAANMKLSHRQADRHERGSDRRAKRVGQGGEKRTSGLRAEKIPSRSCFRERDANLGMDEGEAIKPRPAILQLLRKVSLNDAAPHGMAIEEVLTVHHGAALG